MTNYSRAIQSDNSQGGAKQLYVFPYIEISESNITIADNFLTSFPVSIIYDLNASDITFEESVSEFYEQKVSFKLKKLLAADQLKDLAKKDFRIIIKDNNSDLRLLGLYTGLEGKFTKSIGASRSAFNGYNFNFETKEEQTAPFISTSTFSTFFLNYNNLFEFQVTTSNAGTSNNDQFSLPLVSAFTNNITVYWGDGTNSIITSYNQSEVTHTYPTAGTYTIKILGAITAGWYFGNTGDCLKMGDIANFGGFSAVVNTNFAGCLNMTSIGSDVDFLNQATSLSGYFDMYGASGGLTILPSTLTLANLQNGTQMFRSNSLTALPVVMLLHNLENGSVMFRGNPLTSGLPTGMILGNLTNGYYMLDNCQLPSLPSTITFASVTNAIGLLRNNLLTDLASGITFSNITDGANLLSGNTINTTRYSQLLIDLENLNSNNSFSFHGGNSQYNTSGQTARNILTASPRNLTITDGGLA